MNDISFKTSKGEILRGMMRRPETAKLIKEAMSSGVGSTSRAKAQKIFSIMNKLHSSHDGMGGPGIMSGQMTYGQTPPEMDPVHIPTDESKGMVIFHKIPKPKITYGSLASKFTPRAGSFDGSGGPGNYDGEGGLFDGFSNILNSFSIPTISTQASPATTYQSLSRPSVNSTPAPTTSGPGLFSSIGNFFSNAYNKGQENFADFNRRQSAPFVVAPKTATLPPISTPSFAGAVNTPAPNASSPSGPVYIPPSAPTAPASTWKLPDSSYPSMTNEQIQDQQVADAIRAKSAASPSSVSSPSSSNIASSSVAAILGVPTTTPLASLQISDLASAIAQNEGFSNGTSTIAINNNNPGNLKFVGQPGAVQGDAASDGGYYAKFATVQDGWNALQNDLQAKISSGKYSTLTDLMSVYSPNSGAPGGTKTGDQTGPAKYTGLSALAQKSVDQSTGAGMFAVDQLMDPNNPITHGKTMEELEAANQKSLWAKYNIGGLQDEAMRLSEEGAVLPRDVTSYITARDQYLVQTDKAISDFIDTSVNNTDMSNPANAAKANAQLSYLYTLRGRQNQSYIGYLNDAVTQHQAELDHVTNMYSTALNAYEIDLKNTNAITEGQYKMYASALADMYTAVDGAPLKAVQLAAYNQQILDAHATAVSDAAKKNAQFGYLEQYGKLKGHIVDGDGLAIPGTDLVKQIQDLAVLDPSIEAANIIQTYTEGVSRYMNAPTTKGTATNPGLTSSDQRSLGEEAIKQFAHLAIAGADNPNTVVLGQTSAEQIARNLASSVGGSLVAKGIAPQLMEAVKTLAPSGWFGNKASPTADQFVKTVTDQTKDPLDESIARAIYATFQRFVADGGSPASAVNAFLYPQSSTSDRTAPVAYTPDQFAQNVGTIYASNVLQQAFAPQ